MKATYKVTASSFADLMTVIQVLPLGKCLEDTLSQSGIRWEVS